MFNVTSRALKISQKIGSFLKPSFGVRVPDVTLPCLINMYYIDNISPLFATKKTKRKLRWVNIHRDFLNCDTMY